MEQDKILSILENYLSTFHFMELNFPTKTESTNTMWLISKTWHLTHWDIHKLTSKVSFSWIAFPFLKKQKKKTKINLSSIVQRGTVLFIMLHLTVKTDWHGKEDQRLGTGDNLGALVIFLCGKIFVLYLGHKSRSPLCLRPNF